MQLTLNLKLKSLMASLHIIVIAHFATYTLALNAVNIRSIARCTTQNQLEYVDIKLDGRGVQQL